MLRRIIFIVLFLLCASPVIAQVKQIYVAPDDHTDYLWSANASVYRQAFKDMLDYYIARADATAGSPTELQSRFNVDGTYWLWVYKEDKKAAEFTNLMNHIKSGHIGVPLNGLSIVYGGQPAEAVLRGMYWPGQLERQYNIRFPIAYEMENQTLSLGLASLFAGSGVKYSWKGICACDTMIPIENFRTRAHDIYWWKGLDSQRVLMKWHPLYGNSESLGGYAEARNAGTAIDFVNNNATFKTRYPYNIIGIFGQGWDDISTRNQDIVTTATARTNSSQKVIVSNETDFFQAFEAAYGQNLPELSVSFGNEWELYAAAFTEITAKVKRSVEKLRIAESMATLALLADPTSIVVNNSLRNSAWTALSLFWEHNMSAAGGVVGEAERASWQRSRSAEIDAYVNDLYSKAKVALANLIKNPTGATRFYVYNPLSWIRTDVVDVLLSGSTSISVFDTTTNSQVPSQIIQKGSSNYVRIVAQNIPAVGYKVYEIRNGTGQTYPNLTASQNSVENQFYKVVVSGSGALSSLISKNEANKEYISSVGGRFANDLGGTGAGTVNVESVGPVSATVVAQSTSPLNHTSRITVYANVNRVDIENTINQSFDTPYTWYFPFSLNTPETYHEEVGAVLKAKLTTQGGNYSPINARYDWLTLNHFAAMNGTNGSVSLSNADTSFFKLGNSTVTSLDSTANYIQALAGGRVASNNNFGVRNQANETSILQRFSLQTSTTYSQTNSMKHSLEHQNPLVAEYITAQANATYPETTYSLLTISDPSVLLWALKPAEEGIANGVVIRAWNQSTSQKPFQVSFSNRTVQSGKETTHIETDTRTITPTAGQLSETIAAQKMATYKLITQVSTSSSPTPLPTGTACQKADVSNDGIVDLTDYAVIAINFLKPSSTNVRADINGDGFIDLSDYALLALQFLKRC